MIKSSRSRVISLLANCGIVFMLFNAGCAPLPPSDASSSAQSHETEPLPEPQTSSATPSTPQNAPAPDPTASTHIPSDCEEVLPAEVVQSYHPDLEFTANGEEAQARVESLLGPATVGALSSGEGQIYCGWGISHSGAIAYLGATIMTDDSKSALLTALRDSVYTELPDAESELVFTQGQSSAHKYTDRIIMDGDLLVAVSHTIAGDFAQDALTRIRG